MKHQLGWTSLEQSEKLIEAGLDPNTADMFYLYDWNNHKHNNTPDTLIICNWEDPYNKSIPCWSLGALIGLLPKTIEIKEPLSIYFLEIYPAAGNGVAYSSLNDKSEMIFLKAFNSGNGGNDTLIGNVVNMIVWLLDNKYIKKEN